MPCRWADDPGVRRTLKFSGFHSISLAASVLGYAGAPPKLKGIVETDETYFLESRKADRNLDRKALRRHGKASKRGLSDELVPRIYLHSFKKLGKFCYQFIHLHDILCQAIFHKTWSVSGIIPKIYLWILRHHGLIRNPIMTSFRTVRRSGPRSGPRRIALLRFFPALP